MIISNLSHMETSEATVEGGYYFGVSSSTYITENLNITKYLNSKVDIKGNFAGAEAEATAMGKNSTTQALSFTNTVQGVGSSSSATSISGSLGATRPRGW
jgi:hypothetical protein